MIFFKLLMDILPPLKCYCPSPLHPTSLLFITQCHTSVLLQLPIFYTKKCKIQKSGASRSNWQKCTKWQIRITTRTFCSILFFICLFILAQYFFKVRSACLILFGILTPPDIAYCRWVPPTHNNMSFS